MHLLEIVCWPVSQLRWLITAACVVVISPYAAFAHMITRIFHVELNTRKERGKVSCLNVFGRGLPQFVFILWTGISAALPFLLTMLLIPKVSTLNPVSVKVWTVVFLSLYFGIGIFIPVFVTVRTGWNWMIIDTRYKYFGPIDFLVIQKIQQILGPMVSIADLNWSGSYEVLSLIEDVHIAVSAPADAIEADLLSGISRRTDMDSITRNRLSQLIIDLRSSNPNIRRIATSLPVRATLANSLALFHVVIEFLQLSAISTYHNGIPWLLSFASAHSVVDDISQALNMFGISILSFRNPTYNLVTFWIVVGLVVLWLWMTWDLHLASVEEVFFPGRGLARVRNDRKVAYSHESDNDNDSNNRVDETVTRSEQRWLTAAQSITRSKWHRIVLFFLSDVVFFAVVIKLSGFLSCEYDEVGTAHMTQLPSEVCLQGDLGIAYGVVAMLGLLYYVFTSFCYTNMQCEVRGEILNDFDIQFDHTFTGIERLLKLSTACTMSLFGSFDYVPQACAFFCAVGLHLNLSRRPSCTAFFVDFWRPVLLKIVIVSTVVGACVVATDAEKEWFPLAIFGGVFLLALLVYSFVWLRIWQTARAERSNRVHPLLESLIGVPSIGHQSIVL